MWTARLAQFIKFGMIGAVNTATHGLILVALVEFFDANPVLGNFVGFLVSNLFSYIMNSYLTFKVNLSVFIYLKFIVASLLSLGLTLFISWIMDYSGYHYLKGFLVIILTVPILTFIVMRYWAFADI